MKVKTTHTFTRKAAKIAAVGAAALSAFAIWGRAPIARAVDTAVSYSRLSATLQQVKAELNLTDQQQTKIQIIIREAVPQGVAIHDSMSLSPEQKRSRLQQLKTTTRKRIEHVLTPAQRRKAQALFTSAKPRVQARLQQVSQELQLTNSQKAKVQPILASAFKKGLAIKDDMDLTLAQKYTRAQQLRVETRQQLSSILTPVQMKKLDGIIETAQKDVVAAIRAHHSRKVN